MSSQMEAGRPASLITLFQEGIRLCQEWETVIEEQYSAAGAGDAAALTEHTARLNALAQECASLAQIWPGYLAPAIDKWPLDNASEEGSGRLEDSRREFLDIALKVFGLNYRNVRAMTMMEQLGAAIEQAMQSQLEPTYTRQGALGKTISRPAGLDREG